MLTAWRAPAVLVAVGLAASPVRAGAVQPTTQPVASPVDTDGDGLTDSVDACPEEVGSVEDHGCSAPAAVPDGDGDGDGIADAEDACSDAPATAEHEGCKPPLAPPERSGAAEPEPEIGSKAKLAFDNAVALGRVGSYEPALAKANLALELAPDWADAFRLRAGLYAGLSDEYKPGKRFLEAQQADLEAYLERNPKAPDRAQVLTVLGSMSQRIEKAEKLEKRRGIAMISIAGTVLAVGTVLTALGTFDLLEGEKKRGTAMLGVGIALAGASIPFFVLAGLKHRGAKLRQAAYGRLLPEPPK